MLEAFLLEKKLDSPEQQQIFTLLYCIKVRLAFPPRLSANLPTTPNYTAKEKDG